MTENFMSISNYLPPLQNGPKKWLERIPLDDQRKIGEYHKNLSGSKGILFVTIFSGSLYIQKRYEILFVYRGVFTA
jgi:hypothetical protein